MSSNIREVHKLYKAVKSDIVKVVHSENGNGFSDLDYQNTTTDFVHFPLGFQFTLFPLLLYFGDLNTWT